MYSLTSLATRVDIVIIYLTMSPILSLLSHMIVRWTYWNH